MGALAGINIKDLFDKITIKVNIISVVKTIK